MEGNKRVQDISYLLNAINCKYSLQKFNTFFLLPGLNWNMLCSGRGDKAILYVKLNVNYSLLNLNSPLRFFYNTNKKGILENKKIKEKSIKSKCLTRTYKEISIFIFKVHVGLLVFHSCRFLTLFFWEISPRLLKWI